MKIALTLFQNFSSAVKAALGKMLPFDSPMRLADEDDDLDDLIKCPYSPF